MSAGWTLFPVEQVQAEWEEADVVQFVRSAATNGRDPARCQDGHPAERGNKPHVAIHRCCFCLCYPDDPQLSM